MNLIEIFKPGRHTAMSGTVIEFSESDLKAIASAYDPALHEAPLVVGHPKLDAPAYGWVKSLTYGDTLQAEPDQVDDAFAKLVNAGRFKKISASFFTPNAPANPKPGVYYLRHVGFLGAQPPAVKGLKSASFAGDEAGVIEFGDWSDVQNAGMWRRLRDFMIAQFGLDQADKVVPDYAVASLEESARTKHDTTPAPAFAEPTKENSTMSLTPEQIKALQDENAALRAEAGKAAEKDAAFAEREKLLADRETAARRKEHAEFADALVKDGKLLPRDRDGLVAFMGAVDANTVIEFGEGDAKQTPAIMKWLGDFLSRLPKQVDYSERAGGDKGVPGTEAPEAIAAKAVEFQEAERAKGREISVTAAVAHVTKGATP